MQPLSWYDRVPAARADVVVYAHRRHIYNLEEELIMQRAIVGLLLALLLLAACSSPTPAQPQASESGKPIVTVYKSPT